MICLFLAILELVKRQAITLKQGEAFGDIELDPHEHFEEIVASQQDITAIEQEWK
jgi:segregation and condensation protein A